MEAVVDTGFTRFLTLPSATVAELGLGYRGVNSVVLADGSETTLEVYGVTVLWDGQRREVVAYASDTLSERYGAIGRQDVKGVLTQPPAACRSSR